MQTEISTRKESNMITTDRLLRIGSLLNLTSAIIIQGGTALLGQEAAMGALPGVIFSLLSGIALATIAAIEHKSRLNQSSKNNII